MIRLIFAAAALGAWGFGAPALAAENAMQVCGAKYREAKAANTVPPGQTWQQFLANCRSSMPKATPATPKSPSATTAMATPGAPKPVATRAPRVAGQPTPAQLAERQRLKACGQQWRSAKANGSVPPGQTWPKYWSQCSARMKSAG